MAEQTDAALGVASRIRDRRRLLGLTQEDVGRMVGEQLGEPTWSKATWSTVENPGTRGLRRLDPDELAAIAVVLGTSVAALFGEQQDPAIELIRTLRAILTRLEQQITTDEGEH